MEQELLQRAASVDWSRAQFALTALYHFLFVPLTLGLSFILAIMETIYIKTKKRRVEENHTILVRNFCCKFCHWSCNGHYYGV